MTRKLKNASGITLIALVITIVIMLILASVTINMTIGERGVITKAKQAKIQAKLAEVKEAIQVDLVSLEADNMFEEGLPSEDVVNVLEKYGDVIYSVPGNATTTPVGVVAREDDGEGNPTGAEIGTIMLSDIYDTHINVTIATAEGGTVSNPDTWETAKTVTLPTAPEGYTTIWGTSSSSMTNTYSTPFPVYENCTIYYSYSDGASHGKSGTIQITKIDNDGPTVSELVASKRTTDGFTLTATATDNGGSGIVEYDFYVKESGTEGDYLLKSSPSNTSSSYSIIGLNSSTAYNYRVVVIDALGNESTVTADTTVTTLEPPLAFEAPRLGEGMTAVKWSATNAHSNLNNPTTIAAANVAAEWQNDYYIDKSLTENSSKTQKWANAKTSDGSYWVWIPRYEYKINKTNYTIDVQFIPVDQTTADSGYTIHPAFTSNVNNGGWDKELAGIWVAKYEMSNVSSVAKSIPNSSSWRSLTIGSCYNNAYNCNRTLDSHLMKNSEWGAVAYLTYSKYGAYCNANGRSNGNKFEVNEIAMSSSGTTTANGCSNLVKVTTQGTNPPTSSDNVYGIYDLNGGAGEYVAAYNGTATSYWGYANTDGSGGSVNSGNFAYSTSSGNPAKNSTKYATKYSNSDYNPSSSNYIIGDATYEVYVSYSGSGYQRAWFNDRCNCAYSNGPFFMRGGDYYNQSSDGSTGLFYSYGDTGGSSTYNGFRAVLVVE